MQHQIRSFGVKNNQQVVGVGRNDLIEAKGGERKTQRPRLMESPEIDRWGRHQPQDRWAMILGWLCFGKQGTSTRLTGESTVYLELVKSTLLRRLATHLIPTSHVNFSKTLI